MARELRVALHKHTKRELERAGIRSLEEAKSSAEHILDMKPKIKIRSRSRLSFNQFLFRFILPTAVVGGLTFMVLLSITSNKFTEEPNLEMPLDIEADSTERTTAPATLLSVIDQVEDLEARINSISAAAGTQLTPRQKEVLDNWQSFVDEYDAYVAKQSSS